MLKLAAPFAGLAFGTTLLEQVAGTLGLVAGSVASLGVIFVGGRHLWHFGRNVGRVVENTAELPAFVKEQRAINRAVAERLASVEGQLEAAERAAVTAIVGRERTPRPPRRTDPEPRTGWRE